MEQTPPRNIHALIRAAQHAPPERRKFASMSRRNQGLHRKEQRRLERLANARRDAIRDKRQILFWQDKVDTHVGACRQCRARVRAKFMVDTHCSRIVGTMRKLRQGEK